MREIAANVAARHEITLDQLRGPTRARRFAYARHEAFALIYDTGRFSFTQIGQFIGCDQSTVRTGRLAYQARLAGGKLVRAVHVQQRARVAAQRAALTGYAQRARVASTGCAQIGAIPSVGGVTGDRAAALIVA